MRTVKWNPFLAGLTAVVGIGMVSSAPVVADVTSTNAAAIVIFPKLRTNDQLGIDTTIQLTNVSSQPVNVRCFYVNANGHCADNPDQICDPNQAPGTAANDCNTECEPGWLETDFRMRLTPQQPVGWTVSEGRSEFPLPSPGGTPGGHFNAQSSVPPASEDPFFGELTCVVVGEDELPTDRNWLIGNATIGTNPNSTALDLAGYNAFGIQAIEGANNRDNTLVLGQEYSGCPNILSLSHFYDDATDPISGDNVRTQVTFAPCSRDYNFQIPKGLTIQFLTFNEFEQRFSASESIECLTNLELSEIDTRLGNANSNDEFSIFNVNVQGTLTGQTLMRGVNDDSEDAAGGETFLVVAQQVHDEFQSAAYVAHQRGTRPQVDTIVLPAAAPTGP